MSKYMSLKYPNKKNGGGGGVIHEKSETGEFVQTKKWCNSLKKNFVPIFSLS